jgi:hypothetical protein
VRPLRLAANICFARFSGHRKLKKNRDQEEQQRRTAHNDLHGCLNSRYRLYPMEGNRGSLVDLDGFEPSTSSMPWKRAPNCATGPLLEQFTTPGLTECDLENIDAGDSQHPKNQPECDHGHHDVPNPLRRSLRFGPIFHQAFLRRCFDGGAGCGDFRNASSLGSSICASSIFTPPSSGFFLGSLISFGFSFSVAMVLERLPGR